LRQLFWFILGSLIGGLVGGLLALLLAPATGEQTRTLIREKAQELRQRAQKTGWYEEQTHGWMNRDACEDEELAGDIGKGDSA
jgi:gas vesicle protein